MGTVGVGGSLGVGGEGRDACMELMWRVYVVLCVVSHLLLNFFLAHLFAASAARERLL